MKSTALEHLIKTCSGGWAQCWSQLGLVNTLPWLFLSIGCLCHVTSDFHICPGEAKSSMKPSSETPCLLRGKSTVSFSIGRLSSCIHVILLCRVVIGCFQPGLPQVLYVRDVIIIWGHIQITVRQLYMVAEPRNSTVYPGLWLSAKVDRPRASYYCPTCRLAMFLSSNP